jgi:hypothetical protein
VHTTGSGEIGFPAWDRSGWSEEIIERLEADSDNEHESTYSVWTKS